MSTQAARLNVQGIDAVTPSNEDLNIFRILTTHLLRLLTLPWSIVSLAELPLNCRLAHPPNDWCKWRLHKVLPCHKCLLQLRNRGGPPRAPPPNNTHTHTHTRMNAHTQTGAGIQYTPLLQVIKWVIMRPHSDWEGLLFLFSLQMITLDSANVPGIGSCQTNRRPVQRYYTQRKAIVLIQQPSIRRCQTEKLVHVLNNAVRCLWWPTAGLLFSLGHLLWTVGET